MHDIRLFLTNIPEDTELTTAIAIYMMAKNMRIEDTLFHTWEPQMAGSLDGIFKTEPLVKGVVCDESDAIFNLDRVSYTNTYIDAVSKKQRNEPYQECGNIFTFDPKFMWRWFGARAILNSISQLSVAYDQASIDAAVMFAYWSLLNSIENIQIGIPSTRRYLRHNTLFRNQFSFSNVFSSCMMLTHTELSAIIAVFINEALSTNEVMKHMLQSKGNQNDTE